MSRVFASNNGRRVSSKRLRPQTAAAFTLLEILVVVLLIGLLISMLLPALNRARAAAQTAACLGNLRQIATGATAFAADHKNHFPYAGTLYDYTGNTIQWPTPMAVCDPDVRKSSYYDKAIYSGQGVLNTPAMAAQADHGDLDRAYLNKQ